MKKIQNKFRNQFTSIEEFNQKLILSSHIPQICHNLTDLVSRFSEGTKEEIAELIPDHDNFENFIKFKLIELFEKSKLENKKRKSLI